MQSHQILKALLNENDLAADQYKVEHALKLIGQGADVNTKNDNGETLLHILLQNKEWLDIKEKDFLEQHWITEKIQELVTLFEVDYEATNAAGFTPLQTIMNLNDQWSLGYKPMILINSGFNAQSLDKNGNSLLHLYAETNNMQYLSLIKQLIEEYHLDINLPNSSGYTPIEVLINSGNYTSILTTSLIDLGADPVLLNEYYHLYNSFFEKFKIALSEDNTSDAVYYFCQAHNIKDNSNSNQRNILSRICSLIKKPVNEVFIVRLLEYMDWKCGSNNYFNRDSLSSYIDLWNISHLINGWETVKIELDSLNAFKYDIEMVIHHALDYPKSRALPKLLKEMESKIKNYGNKHTVLQSIVMHSCLSISSFFNNASETLDILFATIKKMAAYNRKLIIEHNNQGEDIVCCLKHLRDRFNGGMQQSWGMIDTFDLAPWKRTVNEMIKFVKNEIKQTVHINASQLFFNKKSLYSQLPQDVKGEIVNVLKKLS